MSPPKEAPGFSRGEHVTPIAFLLLALMAVALLRQHATRALGDPRIVKGALVGALFVVGWIAVSAIEPGQRVK